MRSTFAAVGAVALGTRASAPLATPQFVTALLATPECVTAGTVRGHFALGQVLSVEAYGHRLDARTLRVEAGVLGSGRYGVVHVGFAEAMSGNSIAVAVKTFRGDKTFPLTECAATFGADLLQDGVVPCFGMVVGAMHSRESIDAAQQAATKRWNGSAAVQQLVTHVPVITSESICDYESVYLVHRLVRDAFELEDVRDAIIALYDGSSLLPKPTATSDHVRDFVSASLLAKIAATAPGREPFAMGLIKCLIKFGTWLVSRRMAHRDIKPNNVMLTNAFLADPSAPGSCVLIDFGMAVGLDDMDDFRWKHRAGSPRFIEPAQFLYRDNPTVSRRERTDAFAIAMTAIYTVTEKSHPMFDCFSDAFAMFYINRPEKDVPSLLDSHVDLIYDHMELKQFEDVLHCRSPSGTMLPEVCDKVNRVLSHFPGRRRCIDMWPPWEKSVVVGLIHKLAFTSPEVKAAPQLYAEIVAAIDGAQLVIPFMDDDDWPTA